jgi:hypothetical protein
MEPRRPAERALGKGRREDWIPDYDSSLSGYVTNSADEVFAFSIICNDETGRANSGRLIDEIVSLLATYPQPTTQKAK